MYPIDFSKKSICVVTGASRGIGREIAVQLSKLLCDGSLLVLVARSEADLATTASLLKQETIKSMQFAMDLAVPVAADFEKMMATAAALLPDAELAVIVHNAGSLGTVDKVRTLNDAGDWQAFCNLNIISVGLLNPAFIAAMAGKKMYVVNITSLIGTLPVKSAAMYGLGKAARNYYFKVLALEEARNNVVVVNYSPGPVDTDMFHECSMKVQDEAMLANVEKLKATNTVLTTGQTVSKLMRLLQKGNYNNGDVVDYYDYE